MKSERNMSSRIVGTILVISIILIAFLLIMLAYGKETRIQDASEPKKVSALVCSANGLGGAFFTSSSANNIENEIKITFLNEKLDKLFYSYNGTYRSWEIADQDEAILHARYNIYMGNNGTSQDSLVPSYSVVGTKLQITLYADEPNKINSVTAPLFFIDTSEIKELENSSMETMMDYYERQGFSCENVD